MSSMNRFLCLWLIVLASSPLAAEEWVILGPRAMGMGGAGVAITRGALSSYWNPAGLAPPRAPRVLDIWDLALPASASAAASNDFIREVDDVSNLVEDIDFGALENALENPNVNLPADQLQSALRLFVDEIPELGERGTGVVTNGGAGIMGRVWQFGLSGLALVHAGGVTVFDDQNLALGDDGLDGVIGAGNDRSGQLSPAGQAFANGLAADGLATQNQAEEVAFQSEQAGIDLTKAGPQDQIRRILEATALNDGGAAGNSILDNQSGVDLRGILLQEYALSFAQPFFDIVSVGANVKLMNGWSYFKPYTIPELEGFDAPTGDLFDEDNRRESLNFGIDAGILVQPVPMLSVGVVGRNLNGPSFEFKGPGNYDIDPQFRAGIGVTPIPWLVCGVDVDIVSNESEALPGFDSVIGGGAEASLGDVAFLRFGVSKNLAESDEDPVIHFGVGVRFWLIQLDAAAAFATDSTEIDSGEDIPERVGLSLGIAFNLPLD